MFDFVVNVATAQTLGISIANDVLMQATRLVK